MTRQLYWKLVMAAKEVALSTAAVILVLDPCTRETATYQVIHDQEVNIQDRMIAVSRARGDPFNLEIVFAPIALVAQNILTSTQNGQEEVTTQDHMIALDRDLRDPCSLKTAFVQVVLVAQDIPTTTRNGQDRATILVLIVPFR